MNIRPKNIMNAAWALARQGAQRFGSGAALYFRESLRIVWREYRDVPVYELGMGSRMWMGFVPRKSSGRRLQALLPGLSAK